MDKVFDSVYAKQDLSFQCFWMTWNCPLNLSFIPIEMFTCHFLYVSNTGMWLLETHNQVLSLFIIYKTKYNAWQFTMPQIHALSFAKDYINASWSQKFI